MYTTSLSFTNYKCFQPEFTEVLDDKLITLVIGRNNSGKTQYLDIVKQLCDTTPYKPAVLYKSTGILAEADLRSVFFDNILDGEFRGNHWNDHGQQLISASVEWTSLGDGSIKDTRIFPVVAFTAEDSHSKKIETVLRQSRHRYSGKTFRRLLADRNIRPEPESLSLALEPDGVGATNIVRRYLLASDLDRDLIQQKIRSQLSEIFGTDGDFTEITVRKHEGGSRPDRDGEYEIGFTEKRKQQLVLLSDSGSGLKTVILVLLTMTAIPVIEKRDPSEYVFAFEELENNLHPALLRRLFQFIERYSVLHKTPVFLTSHSSVALDFFGPSTNANILHIKHDGERAVGAYIEKHFDKLGVISELGVKPSDLLQANGVIWVEKPSDCIYVNRWISLCSNGELQEGRDYQCEFYGGALLARAQFCSPEEAEKELVNLLRLSHNIIVICDGDRESNAARIKDRVRRISSELSKIPNAVSWITDAREVENYLRGTVLQTALGLASPPPDPGQYEPFFPRKSDLTNSFWTKYLPGVATIDKVDLAAMTTQHMTRDDLRSRFDLEEKIQTICDAIRCWNR